MAGHKHKESVPNQLRIVQSRFSAFAFTGRYKPAEYVVSFITVATFVDISFARCDLLPHELG
jgi:hypothetical protein